MIDQENSNLQNNHVLGHTDICWAKIKSADVEPNRPMSRVKSAYVKSANRPMLKVQIGRCGSNKNDIFYIKR